MVKEVAIVVVVSIEAAGTRPIKVRPLTAAAAAVPLVRRSVKTTCARAVEGSRSSRHVIAARDDAAAKLDVIV